jgi:DNA-directed RNA polymerase subunit RPC12/RpoP
MVKCKQCGKSAPSTEFTLDPVYRMMVCRKCVEERRMKERPIMAGDRVVKPTAKPVVSVSKPAPKPSVDLGIPKVKSSTAASGSKMKQRCKNCGHVYLYDAEKMYPQNCPQCGMHINTHSQYNFF